MSAIKNGMETVFFIMKNKLAVLFSMANKVSSKHEESEAQVCTKIPSERDGTVLNTSKLAVKKGMLSSMGDKLNLSMWSAFK